MLTEKINSFGCSMTQRGSTNRHSLYSFMVLLRDRWTRAIHASAAPSLLRLDPSLAASHVTLGVCPPLKAFSVLKHTGYVRALYCRISLLLFLCCSVRTGGIRPEIAGEARRCSPGRHEASCLGLGRGHWRNGGARRAAAEARWCSASPPLIPHRQVTDRPVLLLHPAAPGDAGPGRARSPQRKRREVRLWRPTLS
jgi:hypothetical protein